MDSIIATKSSTSNVIKGNMITAHDISISSSGVTSNVSSSFSNNTILLSSTIEGKVIKSFKLNGELIEDDEFIMPNKTAYITDVELVDGIIIETEHYPFVMKSVLGTTHTDVMYENTYDGATSITVRLKYETHNSYYQYVELYSSPSSYRYASAGGIPLTTKYYTIPSNYIKINFTTQTNFSNNYFGFRAVVMPNYD